MKRKVNGREEGQTYKIFMKKNGAEVLVDASVAGVQLINLHVTCIGIRSVDTIGVEISTFARRIIEVYTSKQCKNG